MHKDWDISGSHMAERCGLLIIIALGESLLVTGNTYSHLVWTATNFYAFTLAFTSTVIMWWLYFDGGAEKASQVFAESDTPGQLGRLAYTYFHIPLIAGLILIAVSDELILMHPTHLATSIQTVAIVGGPCLFLVGNLLFKRELLGDYYRGHQLGIITILITTIFHASLSAIVLATLSTIVMLLIALYDNPEQCCHASAKN